MVRFSFAGQDFAAVEGGALWWPRRRALIVADLHFEKASWFAAHGQMLPPYDSIATLTALARLTADHDPAEIWCLGDSFHDSAGSERLPANAQALLQTLTARLDWVWITGNHDAGLGELHGGRAIAEALVDGIMLRHEASPDEVRPEMSGHFHPKLRVSHRNRAVSRRCFVASETKLILPAFGALTGGLDAAHPEILRLLGGGAQALVPVARRMLRFPLAA